MKLSVLIIENDIEVRNRLITELTASLRVKKIQTGKGLEILRAMTRSTDVNTVILDPLAFDLSDVELTIFALRIRVPRVVFLLVVDKNKLELMREQFYQGERRRFLHYYSLDKRQLGKELGPNLEVALELCCYDLDWQMSKDSIDLLRKEVGRLQRGLASGIADGLLDELNERLSNLRRRGTAMWTKEHHRTVFLSFDFKERDYFKGLVKLLEDRAFSVKTGEHTNTYISEAIVKNIEDASLFLSVMTRRFRLRDGTFLPSLWLVEEKALAIAARKPMALMVETGVREIGGLQSDFQTIRFTKKGFTAAALQAVEQLESYVGKGR